MSYEKLCDELMLMTDKIAVAIVEHRDGYKVCERKRKDIVMMEQDKASFGLLRGAQLLEKAKDYQKELGNLHFIVGEFDNLLSFIFPLKDNLALILAMEPSITDFKPFISNVWGVIKKNDLQ